MRLLFDTHVLLWFVEAPETLSKELQAALAWPSKAEVAVSAISFLEIALKKQLGKLQIGDDLPERIRRSPIAVLPMTEEHAWAVSNLPPSLDDHRDPFDRLLAAQAMLEDMTLATRDRVLLKSGLRVMEA